jgi:hypothetical protein
MLIPTGIASGWIGTAVLLGTSMFGVIANRIFHCSILTSVLIIAALLFAVACFIARALFHPKWLRTTTPAEGLHPEIIGAASKWYRGAYRDPKTDFNLVYHDIVVEGKEANGTSYALHGWYVPAPEPTTDLMKKRKQVCIRVHIDIIIIIIIVLTSIFCAYGRRTYRPV